jgi:hypothetical protein
MAIKISNEGEAILLANAVKAAQLKLRLFTNNLTPDGTETVASLTEFGAVQGYVAKALATASWAAAVAGTGAGTSLSNKASIAYPQQTWTFDGTGGSVTAYGYYITSDDGTKLIGIERFPSAVTVTSNGDLIKVTPTLTGSTE